MLKQWHNKAHKDDFNLFVSLPITPAIFGCNPARVALIAKDLRNFSSLSERAFSSVLVYTDWFCQLSWWWKFAIVESLKETFQALAPRQSELFADDSFWRRANGGNVCLWNPLQWLFYIINPLDKIIPPTHRYISYIDRPLSKGKGLVIFPRISQVFQAESRKGKSTEEESWWIWRWNIWKGNKFRYCFICLWSKFLCASYAL